ncbi:hypothetical protein Syun_003489 [Stephania yunnanensis]|uniref:Pentatricopeptide repeat-containing protein n=1 Tax=Stephania yunnanensis TaxID=152371 RepID=A0AAP0L2V9_9MAGN
MRSSGVVPDSGCYHRIMEAYSKIGETDKVLSLFQEFKTQNPKPSSSSPRIFLILCDSLGKSGRPFEALEAPLDPLHQVSGEAGDLVAVALDIF